jgi:threonine dehydratase
MVSRTLNARTGAEVFLKCENFQRMGAFKMRGAYNAVSQLTEEERRRGVVTHSSGNHAQALSLAARLLGVKAVVVMPKNSPQVKVSATRDTYGAEVVFCESTVESRHETTERLIAEHGYTLIHPYDNDRVIAGAGTAALELLQDYSDLEIIVAPVGGGGLLSGTSIAARGFNASIQVYGVEPRLVDDAYRSFRSGKLESNIRIDTIADGLRTNLSERTLSYIRGNVNDIVLVSEREILDAMRFLWERMKLVVEPSGAVSLAAILTGHIPVKGKKIGVIVSGGNIDIEGFFTLLAQKIHD